MAIVRGVLVEHCLYLRRGRRQLSSLPPDAVKLRKAGHLFIHVVQAMMGDQVVARDVRQILWRCRVLVYRLLVQIGKVGDSHSTEGASALLRIQLQIFWHLVVVSVWQLLKSCLRLARALLSLKRQVI